MPSDLSSQLTRMAMCPRCDVPLISTMAFSGSEFYCLDCGAHLGFLSPRGREATPELNARYEALKAEWDEHAGAKLILSGGWYEACPDCRVGGEPHSAHTTDAEREAHQKALEWLRERVIA